MDHYVGNYKIKMKVNDCVCLPKMLSVTCEGIFFFLGCVGGGVVVFWPFVFTNINYLTVKFVPDIVCDIPLFPGFTFKFFEEYITGIRETEYFPNIFPQHY